MADEDCIGLDEDDDLTRFSELRDGPIERERARLEKAHALMECLVLAYNEAESSQTEWQYMPRLDAVAAVARDTVRKSIHYLEEMVRNRTRERMAETRAEHLKEIDAALAESASRREMFVEDSAALDAQDDTEDGEGLDEAGES